MTEAEWLACDDAGALARWERLPATERTVRLFAVACCRRIPALNIHPILAAVIDTVERFADRLATDEELREANLKADDVADRAAINADAIEGAEGITGNTLRWWQIQCAGVAAFWASSSGDRLWTGVANVPGVAADAVSLARDAYDSDQVARDAEKERAIQADLFRDIFGNPFREVKFAPEWRTDTAVALARQMYDSREFSAMPILADALQDAGCDSDAILSHCRDTKQTHVRGCWVVDLVLGKS